MLLLAGSQEIRFEDYDLKVVGPSPYLLAERTVPTVVPGELVVLRGFGLEITDGLEFKWTQG